MQLKQQATLKAAYKYNYNTIRSKIISINYLLKSVKDSQEYLNAFAEGLLAFDNLNINNGISFFSRSKLFLNSFPKSLISSFSSLEKLSPSKNSTRIRKKVSTVQGWIASPKLVPLSHNLSIICPAVNIVCGEGL